MNMSMNSSLSKLALEILIIYTSLLHLFIRKKVQNGAAAVSLAYQLAIRCIHWIWTNADICFWNFDIVKSLQEVSITSFCNTVNNEHLLCVPLLIVMRILAIIVRWINKTDCSWQVSLSESSARHV